MYHIVKAFAIGKNGKKFISFLWKTEKISDRLDKASGRLYDEDNHKLVKFYIII